MEHENSKYFTTGEFAKLCKVNKQTVIYYEQIGLLSPVIKDSKGYRYYSIRQLELFIVIDLLKDLGMSLNDIQQYTQNKSPEEFLSLMYQQKDLLIQKRKELEKNEQIIEAKIKLMEQASSLNFEQISLEQISAANLYLSRNIKDIPDEEFVEAVSDFITELYVKELDTGYPIGGMTMREEVLKGEYTNYNYLYMEQPKQKDSYTFHPSLKGYYLIGYHIGLEKDIDKTYTRIFAEMNRLNLTLGEYVFEEYIYDNVVKNREEEYITKIMVHVI
ncbi:MerR family transcriptional regulator [Niallia sp. Man26]|uniref:MerR family transcriptional regulator n=1 Tax=Niallia sp. Man26 TaxID=2912824 RepID=UPI001EDA9C7D|nr:MerR family transcriptional regulator [Niallia sp. Man26]UPO90174.1 MerR family transcriptional regulator [Niallia sp. Man26]